MYVRVHVDIYRHIHFHIYMHTDEPTHFFSPKEAGRGVGAATGSPYGR
jgi:hypothetical protein